MGWEAIIGKVVDDIEKDGGGNVGDDAVSLEWDTVGARRRVLRGGDGVLDSVQIRQLGHEGRRDALGVVLQVIDGGPE